MIYRREIDGLRAVAVIPVILFHAGFAAFCGGYVGVDIFFVISGYLITSIIIEDIENEKFSFGKFYERRARRIIPALLFVIICCIPPAYIWMMPREINAFFGSIVSVALFSSNIKFWLEDGYFSDSAEIKPLIHTWSLAVEEQFYIFFPIFLLMIWSIGRRRVIWSVVAIAAMSLAGSELARRYIPVGNFYLAPTRAWELLAGSLCAFVLSGRGVRANNALSCVGLGLIVYAIFGFDEATPFPSVYALVPVTGAALVILYGAAGTWVCQLLSARPFVTVGLVSYSAYLWHQPLFAFARIRSIAAPSSWLMGGLAALSLGLAYLTWRYVERPFRTGPRLLLPSRRALLAVSGAASMLLAVVGLLGHFAHGFESRFSQVTLRYYDASQDRSPDTRCFFKDDRIPKYHPQKQCIFGNPIRVDTMLIGDSHMWALNSGLKDQMHGVNYYYIAFGSCPPVPGFTVIDGLDRRKCNKLLVDAFDFASRSGIRTVVLAGRYLAYLDGGYDNGEGGSAVRKCAFADVSEAAEFRCVDSDRRERVLRRLEQQILQLARKFNVVLVYPIPEAGWDVPSHAAKVAAYMGDQSDVTTSYRQYLMKNYDVISLFDRLSRENKGIYPARVQDALCSKATARCRNADNSGVYYIDDNHLSIAGARMVSPIVVRAIRESRESISISPNLSAAD